MILLGFLLIGSVAAAVVSAFAAILGALFMLVAIVFERPAEGTRAVARDGWPNALRSDWK